MATNIRKGIHRFGYSVLSMFGGDIQGMILAIKVVILAVEVYHYATTQAGTVCVLTVSNWRFSCVKIGFEGTPFMDNLRSTQVWKDRIG